jgi:hypothetical protein
MRRRHEARQKNAAKKKRRQARLQASDAQDAADLALIEAAMVQSTPLAPVASAPQATDTTAAVETDVHPASLDSLPMTGQSTAGRFFHQFHAVSEFLDTQLSDSSFSMTRLRHAQRKLISSSTAEETRPHAMDVRDMFRDHMFASGREPLQPGESALNISGFDRHHIAHCPQCSHIGSIDPSCYYPRLRRCLTHGFSGYMKPDSTGTPVPIYDAQGKYGNHASFDQYPAFYTQQFQRLVDRHKISPATGPICQNPLGVKIPHARWQQAYTLTGIKISDDDTYLRAAEELDKLSVNNLKRRMVCDGTGSGVNDLYWQERFRYISIDDVIELVTPDCFMSVCDIEAYYHNFGLDRDIRRLFGLRTEELGPMVWNVFPFGWSQAPYLASTVTAELAASIRSDGTPTVAMIDDFFTAGKDETEGRRNQHRMHTVLEGDGFKLCHDKEQFGQQVVMIGFHVNSVNMTVSVPAINAQGFYKCIDKYKLQLRSGQHIGHNTMRHICGKLNDFAKVAQEGRSRVSYCWTYLKHGPNMSPRGIELLLADLDWWSDKLATWSKGDATGCEYPIVNRDTLLGRPDAIEVLISDASGTDGFGGIIGQLLDPDPRVFSVSWPADRVHLSSFIDEISALRYHLTNRLAEVQADPALRARQPLLLLWVTDNQGAALSINSGSAHGSDGQALLHEIFELAGALRLSLVSLWHPRESNTFADHLSHLAYSMNSPSYHGRTSDFGAEGAPNSRGADSGEEVQQDSSAAVQPVPAVLPTARSPDIDPAIRGSGRLPDCLPTEERRTYSVSTRSAVESTDPVSQARNPIPDGTGRVADQRPSCRASVMRHDPYRCKESSPFPPDSAYYCQDGLDRRDSATGSDRAVFRQQFPPPYQGGDSGTARIRLHLEAAQCGGPSEANQDGTDRSRNLHRGSRVHSPFQRRATASASVEDTRLGQSPGRVRVLPYRPSPDWSPPGAYSSGVCHLVPTTDQTSGSQHRPQPKEVLGTLPPGRRCYRPVRRRDSLLRHQEDGQVEIRRSPAVLSV